MSFISWQFIAFVLLSLLVYYIAPKKIQWVILLLVSYAFYSMGGISAIGYLLFTTFTTYISGILLGKLNKKQEGEKEWFNSLNPKRKEKETLKHEVQEKKLKLWKKLCVHCQHGWNRIAMVI